MIATLTGVVAEKLSELVVIDVQGVGYGVYVTAEDYGRLAVGEKTKVYAYEHIRENTHDLFAFVSAATKGLFELLLTVNGVGPKMALNILSIGDEQEVRHAIAGGDTKFISRATGVGKRVAERVVVELKDKVGLTSVELSATGMLTSEGLLRQDEAAEALISLGYSPQDAAKALEPVDKDLPVEDRVKQALKGAV